MAKPTKEETRMETVDAPGVAEVILWERIASAAEARSAAAKARCLPTLAMFYVEEARRTDNLPKTYRAEDGEASCNVQLRSKGKRALSPEAVARLGQAKIPLRTSGPSLGINSAYLSDQSVLKALKKLAQNPKNGLPSDLIVDQDPTITVDDSSLLRVLRLQPKDAVTLLSDVADISLQKPMIDWTEAAKMLRDNPGSGEDADIIDAIVQEMGGAPTAKSSPAPVPVVTAPEPTGKRDKVAEVVPMAPARGRKKG